MSTLTKMGWALLCGVSLPLLGDWEEVEVSSPPPAVSAPVSHPKKSSPNASWNVTIINRPTYHADGYYNYPEGTRSYFRDPYYYEYGEKQVDY